MPPKLGRQIVEGMDIPAEIARLGSRREALAEAKRAIEARAQERFEQE
uniref:Uncharacterized protein n=1 Tax=Methylophaga nitratireducenticrescens TaxID=754476 RepID=I1XNB4_METNJ